MLHNSEWRDVTVTAMWFVTSINTHEETGEEQVGMTVANRGTTPPPRGYVHKLHMSEAFLKVTFFFFFLTSRGRISIAGTCSPFSLFWGDTFFCQLLDVGMSLSFSVSAQKLYKVFGTVVL